MAGISKMYDSLRTEYYKTEIELKNVDQRLRKLDESNSFRKSFKKMDNRKYNRKSYENDGRYNRNHFENDRSYVRSNGYKRRYSESNSNVFSRLGKKVPERDYKGPRFEFKLVSAKCEENVVADVCNYDKRSDERNKRMFGVVASTLEKFQSEETQNKSTPTKPEETENNSIKAVEETTKQDEQTRSDRKSEDTKFGNFIQTKTKPHIFYMPVKLTPETEKQMKETKDKFSCNLPV